MDYFQASLPLHDGVRVTGWISAAVSGESVADNARQMVVMINLVYAGCLILVIPLAIILASSFSKRIVHVAVGLKNIAEGEGDLTRRLEANSKDELGDRTHWFNVFMQRLQGIIREIAGNAGHLADSSTDLKVLCEKMADSATEMSGESAKDKIEGIQQTTRETVDAIESITVVINDVTRIGTTISTAVEEQSNTTAEIVGNVAHASKGVEEVNQSIHALSRLADELNRLVGCFGI